MDPGTLIFINGNQAAIVLGDGVDGNGQYDGSLIVGTFASAEKIEQGHYGTRPGLAAEHPPSYVPEGMQQTQAGPVQTFVPTAGGTPASELAPVDDAGAVTTGAQAGGQQAGTATNPSTTVVEGVTAPGSTSVDFTGANEASEPVGSPPGWTWDASSGTWVADDGQHSAGSMIVTANTNTAP